jgi:hypothetical protein
MSPLRKIFDLGLKSGNDLLINNPSLKAGVIQVPVRMGFSPKLFIVILISILFTASCSRLHIEKPAESYNPESFTPKYSTINIPVQFDIKNLEKLVNRQFNGLVYADTSFENNNKDNLMIKAWKTGDFRISMVKNELSYKIPLRVWIRKKFEIGSFGISLSDSKEVTAEIVLKFRTHITLNKNWTFSTMTFSDGYDWISTPQLKLGPVNLPIPYIADLIVQGNLSLVNVEIDRSLRSLLDLRQYMQKIWTDIQKPILLSSDYQVWAKITPIEMSTIPLQTTTSIIDHSIGIKAVTALSYGREPEYSVNSTLPEIRITSRIDNSFQINLPVDIPFEKINELARQQMVGYQVTQGTHQIRVNDLSVYGHGDDLVVALNVSGSINGTIYLAGKPFYDKDSSSIKIRDLDFDIRTKNVLYKSASWIFHHGLVQTLEKKLQFPVGKDLEQTRKEIQSYLDQHRKLDIFTMDGTIRNLTLNEMIITKNSVKVYFVLEGNINVKMEPE